MKSRNGILCVVMLIVVMVLSGCSSDSNQGGQNSTGRENPTVTEEALQGTPNAGNKQDMVIGTISNIKGSMFTVTDELGASYTFLYEGQEPIGLEEVKDGDDVVVRYLGTVSTLEPFSGAILSVAPAI